GSPWIPEQLDLDRRAPERGERAQRGVEARLGLERPSERRHAILHAERGDVAARDLDQRSAYLRREEARTGVALRVDREEAAHAVVIDLALPAVQVERVQDRVAPRLGLKAEARCSARHRRREHEIELGTEALARDAHAGEQRERRAPRAKARPELLATER